MGVREKARFRRLGVIATAALALVALGACASVARADDSQIRIKQVYTDGTAAHGDYIELQMMADGQTIPAGSAIRMCNATCSGEVDFLFPPNATLPASTRHRTC